MAQCAATGDFPVALSPSLFSTELPSLGGGRRTKLLVPEKVREVTRGCGSLPGNPPLEEVLIARCEGCRCEWETSCLSCNFNCEDISMASGEKQWLSGALPWVLPTCGCNQSHTQPLSPSHSDRVQPRGGEEGGEDLPVHTPEAAAHLVRPPSYLWGSSHCSVICIGDKGHSRPPGYPK